MAAPTPEPVAFAFDGPLADSDLCGYCERVRALLEQSGASMALCDVSRADPDAVTINALARLQLAARRQGCELEVRHASAELLDLLDFMGLRDVLPG
jgi:ABC-type transporter Mla MlaB component